MLVGEKAPDLLAWKPDCHPLFLFYRDALRDVWTLGPRANRYYLSFLLGMLWSQSATQPPIVFDARLKKIWAGLESKYGCIEVAQFPPLQPMWLTGDFMYTPMQVAPRNEFQVALYLLFRESWRAKVCAHCSKFFVAEKPAQRFCDGQCSNVAHRASALKWWKREGAKWRAQKKTAAQKSDAANRRRAR